MCPGGKYAGLDHPAGAGDLRPAFDVLDADRDGRISRDDLKSFYATNTAGNAAGTLFLLSDTLYLLGVTPSIAISLCIPEAIKPS
jgi:hypothetical protein